MATLEKQAAVLLYRLDELAEQIEDKPADARRYSRIMQAMEHAEKRLYRRRYHPPDLAMAQVPIGHTATKLMYGDRANVAAQFEAGMRRWGGSPSALSQ